MTAQTRAQGVADAIKSVSFPADIKIGNAVVRLSRPKRVAPGAVSFRAVVRVDGKIIDRDEHIIVNPPTLIADAAGNVDRVFNKKDGTQTVGKFRFDPIACIAQVVLEAALGKAG